MNYKNYQQVLDLSAGKKRPAAKPAPVTGPVAPKRRTKTGCLTCRTRKKKCDEGKVGGKCQNCIRNFLDCCWPGQDATKAEAAKPVAVKVETKNIKTENFKIESFKAESPKTENHIAATKGASAYPSPISSPEVKPLEMTFQPVQKFSLPPIKEMVASLPPIKEMVAKPRRLKSTPRALGKAKANFVITSFDRDHELCQIKS